MTRENNNNNDSNNNNNDINNKGEYIEKFDTDSDDE